MGGNQSAPARLDGKTVLITGANSGVGYETALKLSEQGAEVILACRSHERGEAALNKLKTENPNAKVSLKILDLASLADVERFSNAFLKEGTPLDILINNAGIRNNAYETSIDGFESQIATNYLGHFALTGRLLPALHKSKAPRVVTVGSLAASRCQKPGLIDGQTWTRATAHLLNIDLKKSKDAFNADACYAESKCANLMFMKTLGVRHPRILSVAGHPGGSATNILGENEFKYVRWAMQSAKMGCLPIVLAASDPFLSTGAYLGPRWGLRGYPTVAWFPQIAKDEEFAKAYWDASVKATGVNY